MMAIDIIHKKSLKNVILTGQLQVTTDAPEAQVKIMHMYPFLAPDGSVLKDQFLLKNQKGSATVSNLKFLNLCAQAMFRPKLICPRNLLNKWANFQCGKELGQKSVTHTHTSGYKTCETEQVSGPFATPFSICKPGSSDLVVSSPQPVEVTAHCGGIDVKRFNLNKGNNIISDVQTCDLKSNKSIWVSLAGSQGGYPKESINFLGKGFIPTQKAQPKSVLSTILTEAPWVMYAIMIPSILLLIVSFIAGILCFSSCKNNIFSGPRKISRFWRASDEAQPPDQPQQSGPPPEQIPIVQFVSSDQLQQGQLAIQYHSPPSNPRQSRRTRRGDRRSRSR